jgi:hypothetical protein
LNAAEGRLKIRSDRNGHFLPSPGRGTEAEGQISQKNNNPPLKTIVEVPNVFIKVPNVFVKVSNVFVKVSKRCISNTCDRQLQSTSTSPGFLGRVNRGAYFPTISTVS